jgi:hypothetical protein
MKVVRRVLVLAAGLGLAATLGACGGGGGSNGGGCSTNPAGPGCATPPPPAPSASISGTGGGSLVLHPSIDGRFAVAMETPIRITESAGGAADWGFARMQIFNRGVEVERTELTANDIRAAGFGRIGANSNSVYRVIFRFNTDDFDRIDITLGFSDVKDARQFTAAVPFGSFTDVNVNFTPMSRSHVPM